MNPTQKWIDGLRWIAEREPVSLFPFDGFAPGAVIRKKLLAFGLMETCEGPERAGPWRLTHYRVSAAGRDLLATLPNADA